MILARHRRKVDWRKNENYMRNFLMYMALRLFEQRPHSESHEYRSGSGVVIPKPLTRLIRVARGIFPRISCQRGNLSETRQDCLLRSAGFRSVWTNPSLVTSRSPDFRYPARLGETAAQNGDSPKNRRGAAPMWKRDCPLQLLLLL